VLPPHQTETGSRTLISEADFRQAATRAAELNRLKPHIELGVALATVQEADRLKTRIISQIAST
jgi:hypothetical protein